MPAFDTSVLVPLFIEDHEHHARAKQAFTDADDVILHPTVIAEFTTVIRRITKDIGEDGDRAARIALKALVDEPRVEVRADMDHAGAIGLYLVEPTISFTDAVLSESRWHMDKQAPITFDKGIHRATGITAEERQERLRSLS